MVLCGRTGMWKGISAGTNSLACFEESEGTKRLRKSWRTTRETHDGDKRLMSYYVYLLLCDDGSYYTGYTTKLASRLHQHKRGQGARYTRMRRPKGIVYLERFETRRAAMRRERQIKALSHNQKHDLARKAKTISSKPMRPGYRRRMPFRVT